MMSSWKDSFYLALLELRTQFAYVILGWFVIFIIGGLFFSSFYNYLQNNHPAFDFIFVAYFFAFPYWMRSRRMIFQKLNDKLHASTFVLLLAQLPVSKTTIMRSRLIAYYLFSLPILVMTLMILFAFDVRLYEVFNLGTYLIFFVVWISLSAWFGIALVAIEAGTKHYAWHGMIGLLLLAIIFSFHHYLQMGLVAWTANMAHNYPLQTFITSIIIFMMGCLLWLYIMQKRFTEVDYL